MSRYSSLSKLDTGFRDFPQSPAHLSATSPTSSASPRLSDRTTRHTASPGSSPVTASTRRFRRTTEAHPETETTAARGATETQKLLDHLLCRLETRREVPDELHTAAVSSRSQISSRKNRQKDSTEVTGYTAVSAAQTYSNDVPIHPAVRRKDADFPLSLGNGTQNIDETYSLLEQTRGLLILANKQQLALFSASTIIHPTPPGKTGAGRWKLDAGSFRPSISANHHDISDGVALLARLLAVLRLIISVDCRYKIHNFRPLCPPNGLSFICLDIATLIYHQGELDTQLDVAEIVVDGFYGMEEEMSVRLCQWLEGRLEELLQYTAQSGRKGTVSAGTVWTGKPLQL
jgi:hypothetical protein